MTTTRPGSKRTFLTHTPGRHRRRKNAAVTRTDDDLQFDGLSNPRTYGPNPCASANDTANSAKILARHASGSPLIRPSSAGIHASERTLVVRHQKEETDGIDEISGRSVQSAAELDRERLGEGGDERVDQRAAQAPDSLSHRRAAPRNVSRADRPDCRRGVHAA